MYVFIHVYTHTSIDIYTYIKSKKGSFLSEKQQKQQGASSSKETGKA